MSNKIKANIGTSFGKHDARMYTGSMVGKGAIVFAVMGYVIANQRPGREEPEKLFVEMNPELLAFILGEDRDKVAAAIEFLCAPDARSRTKAEEGRRLVRLGEFLFWVVNGRLYRSMGNPGRRREQWRESQRKTRKKKSRGATASERQFVEAHNNGDVAAADRIVEQSLPEAAKLPSLAAPG